MKDREIIKALECCKDGTLTDCDGCPCFCDEDIDTARECAENLMANALDLINRLQEENKRLSTLAELGNKRADDYRVMRDRALKAEAENERLQGKVKGFEKIRRAYQRMIHESMPNIQAALDNVLKELVGDDNV